MVWECAEPKDLETTEQSNGKCKSYRTIIHGFRIIISTHVLALMGYYSNFQF